MRIKLTLAYDGTKYHGWQLQNSKPTIQGFLESALKKLCLIPLRVHGSGRTDAGTHALGQVAHFDPPRGREHLPWQKALNSILPQSIRIIKANCVSRDFHARFSAVSKTYSYTFWTEPDFIYPQRRNYVWKTGHLDLEAMNRALPVLIGKKDFKAFMNTGTNVSSTCREIFTALFVPGLYPYETVLRITADGFLKQMVRNIAGALVVIGRNKYKDSYLETLISGKNRALGPATAPARGLCLEKVEYRSLQNESVPSLTFP